MAYAFNNSMVMCKDEMENEDTEYENIVMDEAKEQRFICLLRLIDQEKEHVFGELRKVTSDGTIVTPESKKLAIDKIARATFDLGFTRRLYNDREWRPRFWGRWKGIAKRRMERRQRTGGQGDVWELMILHISGIDQNDPGLQPALEKWSAVVNGANPPEVDFIDIDRKPDVMDMTALVQQFTRPDSERPQEVINVAALERNVTYSPKPASTKRRRVDVEDFLPPKPPTASDVLARTQALLNVLEAIPKAQALGYDIHPSFYDGLLIKKTDTSETSSDQNV